MQTQHTFQTEVQQLLQLMIHSLYKNKEVFLRELIANAADALHKRNFAAITNADMLPSDESLRIRVSATEQGLVVEDNGIGMTLEELHANLGTIAHSDTLDFLRKHQNQEALIGQFGVGFYSVFMVASQVCVQTRKAGQNNEQGYEWRSSGSDDYEIRTLDKTDAGTRIELSWKSDAVEAFSDPNTIKELIQRYSNHIHWPIEMPLADQPSVWQAVNSQKPVWQQEPKSVEPASHTEFYRHISASFDEPALVMHNRVEGNIRYTMLIYVRGNNLGLIHDREQASGLNLYVRSVFINDVSRELLPKWLRFCCGVIDSPDLPLNVSREFIQNSDTSRKIRASLTQRIVKRLKQFSQDEPEQYMKVWQQHGLMIKEGIIESPERREDLAHLLRFGSNQHKQGRSLMDIVAEIGKNQDTIPYIAAENHQTAASSPHLGYYEKNGQEVLFCCDSIDEWVLNALGSFEGKDFRSISRDHSQGADNEPTIITPEREKLAPLVAALQQHLKDLITEVRLSERLLDYPASLLTDEHDLGINLRRILKAQGQQLPAQKLVMQLNPNHPIIQSLSANDANLEQWAHCLFDLALLCEGGKLENPAASVGRISGLLAGAQNERSAPRIQTL